MRTEMISNIGSSLLSGEIILVTPVPYLKSIYYDSGRDGINISHTSLSDAISLLM